MVKKESTISKIFIAIALLQIFCTSISHCGIFDDVYEELEEWIEYMEEFASFDYCGHNTTTTSTTTTTTTTRKPERDGIKVPILEICDIGNFVCLEYPTCIDSTLRCNKFADCPRGSDEEHCNNSQWLAYRSPSKYEFLPYIGVNFDFYVKASENVSIAFTEFENEDFPLLEVLIGESGGRKSEIFFNKKKLAEVNLDGILSASEYKKFSITFENQRKISVHRYLENGHSHFLLRASLEKIIPQFKYFGFTTRGAGGKFKFNVKEEWNTHKTPSVVKYRFTPIRNNRFEFRIKAKHDCLLVLSPTASLTGNGTRLRVIIGGWKGTKSSLRFLNGSEVITKNTSNMLSKNEFRQFLVALSMRVTEVGEEKMTKRVTTVHVYAGNSTIPFLHAMLDRLYNFKFIGYSTGWDATGSWEIYDYPEAKIVPKPPNINKYRSSSTGLSVGAKVGIAIGSFILLGILSFFTFGIASAIGGATAAGAIESVALAGVESGIAAGSEAAIGAAAAETVMGIGAESAMAAEEGAIGLSFGLEGEAAVNVEETLMHSEASTLLRSRTVQSEAELGRLFTDSYEHFSTTTGARFLQRLGSNFQFETLRRFTVFASRVFSESDFEMTEFSPLLKLKTARSATPGLNACLYWNTYENGAVAVECKAICNGKEVNVFSTKHGDHCLNFPAHQTCHISKCALGNEEYNRSVLRTLVHPLEDGAVSPLGHIQILASDKKGHARKILADYWGIYFPYFLFLPHRTRPELVVQCVLMLFAYGYSDLVIEVARTLELHEIEEIYMKINQIKKLLYYPPMSIILEMKTNLLKNIQEYFGLHCAEFINEALQGEESISSGYSDTEHCQYEYDSIARGLDSLEFPLDNDNVLHSSLILFSSLMSLAIEKYTKHESQDILTCRRIFWDLDDNNLPGYEVKYLWRGISTELKVEIISFSCLLYGNSTYMGTVKFNQNILQYNKSMVEFQYSLNQKLHREMFLYHKPLVREQLPLVQMFMKLKLANFRISIFCINIINEFHYKYTGRLINCQSDERCIRFVSMVYFLQDSQRRNNIRNIDSCLCQLSKINLNLPQNLHGIEMAALKDLNTRISEDICDILFNTLENSQVRDCLTNIGYLLGLKENYDRNCIIDANILMEFSYDLAHFLYKILIHEETAINWAHVGQYMAIFKRSIYGMVQFLDFHGKVGPNVNDLLNFYERLYYSKRCEELYFNHGRLLDMPSDFSSAFTWNLTARFSIAVNIVNFFENNSTCLNKNRYRSSTRHNILVKKTDIDRCYKSEEWQTILNFYKYFDNVFFHNDEDFAIMGVPLRCAILGLQQGLKVDNIDEECTAEVLSQSAKSLLTIYSIYHHIMTNCYIAYFVKILEYFLKTRKNGVAHFCNFTSNTLVTSTRTALCELFEN